MPDSLADLGVSLSAAGGTLRVWSASATSMELCTFDSKDPNWTTDTLSLERGAGDVWSVTTALLAPGVHYSIRADGPATPGHAFDPSVHLIDPYARGLARSSTGE